MSARRRCTVAGKAVEKDASGHHVSRVLRGLSRLPLSGGIFPGDLRHVGDMRQSERKGCGRCTVQVKEYGGQCQISLRRTGGNSWAGDGARIPRCRKITTSKRGALQRRESGLFQSPTRKDDAEDAEASRPRPGKIDERGYLRYCVGCGPFSNISRFQMAPSRV